MKAAASLTGETFDHKVAAIFNNEVSARNAAKTLVETTSLADAQIFVVGPNDAHPGWELEPEDRGIWRTLVRSHIWLALMGAGLGVILFAVLYILGIQFVVLNPKTSAAIAIGFGAVFGMMFAGLLTLRPDHMPYISIAQSALRKGKYVVAVHARSAEQLKEAETGLHQFNVQTISTL